MIKGIHLTLLIGPGVPITAPAHVIEALESVSVNVGGDRTGFQLTFKVGKNSAIEKDLIPTGYFDPIITRVIIMVTVNGVPEVLSDGLVTNQEMSPSNEPGQSKLSITGEDLSLAMDLMDMSGMQFMGMPDNLIALAVLSKYQAIGITPLVVPAPIMNFPLPTEQAPTQSGTDAEYVRSLASNNGVVFYLEATVPGQNIAYWGPDVRIPDPQPALNVNMDAHTNVESLSVSLDGLKKKLLVTWILDPITKKIPIPLPVPKINIFHPPLGARPIPPSKIEYTMGMAKKSLGRAAADALGELTNTADALSVSGSLDVLRYGRVLKARRLVGVRGAGRAYNGLYYVNSVTHEISRGGYKQNFTLSRDGMISLTPKVVA